MRFLFCVVFLAVFSNVYTQNFQNICLHDYDGEGYAPCEPSIAVNSRNPKRIVAGSILNNVYYSRNGGKKWKKKALSSSHGVFGDPCIVAGGKKEFFYLHLSDPKGEGWNSSNILDRIVCQRTNSNGRKWNNGGFMGNHHPKDQDKEWAVYNEKNGELYCTWTQFDKYDSTNPKDFSNILFSKSKDGGETWTDAKQLNKLSGNCTDDDPTTEGAVPAVGPNGEIYVAWALNETIFFDKSLDGGKTWLENDIEAARIIGGWNMEIPGISRCNGMPILCCDNSKGPNRGTLYLNWSDQRNGIDDTDIWMCKSDDGGENWSAPKRVNDDSNSKHQFFTWMTVDQSNGDIYTVFYDRRSYSDNQTDVYVARSIDGGESFENMLVSTSPFVPNSNSFFGDYNNISAHDGTVRPIWTRMEANGRTSVWVALMDFSK